MSDLSYFKRLVYEPEVAALKQRIATLERVTAERDEAEAERYRVGDAARDLARDTLLMKERAERQRDRAIEALRNGMECGETVAIRAWCACVLAAIEKEQA